MNKLIKITMVVIILLISFNMIGTLPVQAATSENSCTIWANSPTQTGSTLYAKGYANCGSNGRYLPYLQLCIVKKTLLGNKTIGCSEKDLLGAYLSPWNKKITVACDGKGTYYAELRWKEITIKDLAQYLFNISTGNTIQAVKSLTGTTFYSKSIPYTYCK